MIQDKDYVAPDDEDEEEDEEDVSADDIKAIVRFLAPFCQPYRWTLAVLALLVLIEAGLNFSFPLVTQYLIDEGLIKKEWQALINSLLFMGIAAISVSLVALLADYVYTRLFTEVTKDIRQHLFDHVQSMSMPFFHTTPTGPYLFSQWGPLMATFAGVFWFGLLFFAGITSSLAMGTPVQGFLEDEFKWSRKKTALAFGLIILIIGMPTVLFFNQGVFDEYDYWTGSFALFVFAACEAILFAWFFGIKKGWKEINTGADIKVSRIFRFLIAYVTPVLLIIVFLGAVFTPVGNDWIAAFQGLSDGQGWAFDHESLVGKLMNNGLKEQIAATTDPAVIADLKYRMLLSNLSRLLLLAVFIGIALVVRKAYYRHKKEGRLK